ncbi:MAG: response regulator transcription factor [Spirochaetales bacterium]|nr:response regulator transcription factor [Spirochaetales bacterium]
MYSGYIKKRILIVESHPIVRRGLKDLISEQPHLECAGEAEDALQALQQIKSLLPDLVITELALKAGNGLDLIKELKALYPELYILVFSGYDEILFAERAIHSGAMGYVMKSEHVNTLLSALHTVLSGKVYVSNALSGTILTAALKKASPQTQTALERLTDRELEIFQALAGGLKADEIVKKLNVSCSTVYTHLSHIKKKLGLKSNHELMRFALHWQFQDRQAKIPT